MSVQGKHFVVSRSATDGKAIKKKLEQLGVTVSLLQTVKLKPISVDRELWTKCETERNHLHLAVTSKNGVRFLLRALKQQYGAMLDNPIMRRTESFFAIGRSTAKLLQRACRQDVMYPTREKGGTGLLEEIKSCVQPGATILVPQSGAADRDFVDGLTAANFDPLPVRLYEPVTCKSVLPSHPIDGWVIFSGSQARALCQMHRLTSVQLAQPTFCMGQKTLEILRDLGFSNVRMATESSVDALVASIAAL